MKNPFLVGTRIYLRAIEREDAHLFVTWLNDSDVNRTLLTSRPINLPYELDWVEKSYHREHDITLGIALKETDQLIGSTGLHKLDYRNRHAMFGILIGEKSEWNKGYGTEATALTVKYAFETLNLNRVWLHVYEHNARGIKAYEKAGFRQEGVLRQDSYREGRYWNTITMAILREEWDALK
ncbi:GNAT family N-acetyltransferase [Candidatus Acetothermia bacterium]|nr:GNAT family N-acetyltransferase [Candidatus Acetothermia bacterium]MBI3460204.1 GNAT family N-acetyltransferase [Candidatus Acetothermia bacterium]